jgi:hypothetical protein
MVQISPSKFFPNSHTYVCTQTSISCSHDAGLYKCMYQFLRRRAQYSHNCTLGSSHAMKSSHPGLLLLLLLCLCRWSSFPRWCISRGSEVTAISPRVLTQITSDHFFSYLPKKTFAFRSRRKRRGLLIAHALILGVILFAGLLVDAQQIRHCGNSIGECDAKARKPDVTFHWGILAGGCVKLLQMMVTRASKTWSLCEPGCSSLCRKHIAASLEWRV